MKKAIIGTIKSHLIQNTVPCINKFLAQLHNKTLYESLKLVDIKLSHILINLYIQIGFLS